MKWRKDAIDSCESSDGYDALCRVRLPDSPPWEKK